MKRYISYFAVLLAVLLGAACSKDDSAAGSDNRTGVMAMTVSTRQTADTGEYDPLQHQTVYIYNDEGGLLRKYTSKEACPERLELLAGTYRVAVEAGEEAPADFTKRLYKGEETFTVKPGETTNVAVVCQIVNTVVEVKFDDSILQNLAPGYSVWIAGGEKVDEQAAEAGSVPALRFTAEGTGYYTLPAGMTSLAWLFRGTHVEGKNVEMEDYIPNVKAGGKYTLTFKYSPDLPGYIDCVLISVDPGTDDKDDEIIFSPDPAVISEGFDIAEIQKYVSGEKKYRILAFSELTRFTVSVGDKSYDALNGTTEGISLEPVDKYNVRLTLSDAFFASCQAGDQKVTLRIEDANGGSSEVATTYRLEGLVPVTADDYDLWANTVTLRVVSFTPGTTVQFGLRSSGGEWQPMAGTSQGDDFITATYAPQWVPQTVKEQTVYTQAAGTGIIATHSYDFRAIINGTETTGTFTAGEVQPIPNGDMSGWSMTGGFAFPNAAGESFWSSGNNTMTKTLCTSTDVKFGKSAPAAKLTSTNMLVLAAGNLFTGEFAYKSFTGTVQFGQTYAFTARPSAMKVKYHAHVGTVDKVRTSGDICPYIKKGDPDMARIFVAIVDWNAPHEVVSGMTTTKGAWDPEKGIDNVSEGKILGYGSLWITQSTDGEDMQDAELDIVWYDHETRPAEGKVFARDLMCLQRLRRLFHRLLEKRDVRRRFRMGILTIKRKRTTMRKITTSTLLALLLLAGTAPESRAQQTNAAASLAPQADSTSCMQHEERPQTVNEMRRQRGLTEKHNLFVPRGQWIFGGTASYSTHSNDTYRFLVIEGIESKGYTFKVSPMIAYAFRDNMALGGRFIYSRSLLKLDKADLNLGGEDSDLNFELNDCYSLQQSYSVAMIWRQYIPLGRNKRFALFNEMQLSGGGTQARFAKDSPVKGTYQTGYTFSLGISPGIIAFATNNMAVEVNVGVMGISYSHTKQVHNQVTVGKRDASMMNFKVNIFSIGLGMAFYL